MWEKLQALPMVLIGTVLTHACIRVGICGLLGIVSGARSSPPYGPAADSPWTLSIPTTTRNVHEMVGLVRAFRSARAPAAVRVSGRTLLITGTGQEIERLAHIVREIDEPATAGQRIWTFNVRGSTTAVAESLAMLSEQRRCWPAGARISKIIPDDATHRVIVVGNEDGYLQLVRMRLEGCPDLLDPTSKPIERPVQWWNPR